MIYLDANATTPLLPEVLEAMLPWLRDGFANPSGSYAGAKLARKAIDQARGQVAELIGADAGEIVFTSGGTESVNTALHSLDRLAGQGIAVVSAIEHSAVLRCVENRGKAYIEGLGPAIAFGSGISRAPGKAATSSFVRNPEAGMGGNAWPGRKGIA